MQLRIAIGSIWVLPCLVQPEAHYSRSLSAHSANGELCNKVKNQKQTKKFILAFAKSGGQRWGTSERKARAGLRVRLLRVSSVGLTERSSGLSPLVWSGRMNSDIKDLLVGASLPVKKNRT